MNNRLRHLGICRVAVADDNPANLRAALEYASGLDGVFFDFYRSGGLLVARMPGIYIDTGLVITDLRMETPEAGLDVIEQGWRYHVPSMVCHERKRGGENLLMVAPANFSLHGMSRDNLETWEAMMENLVEGVESADGSVYRVMKSVIAAGGNGVKVPNDLLGKQARILAKDYLENPRQAELAELAAAAQATAAKLNAAQTPAAQTTK